MKCFSYSVILSFCFPYDQKYEKFGPQETNGFEKPIYSLYIQCVFAFSLKETLRRKVIKTVNKPRIKNRRIRRENFT